MTKKIIAKAWNSPTIMTWGNMLSNSAKLLILTPLILTRYNIDEIAFWYLLLTINTFTIVIDFGFYPTFSRIISYAFNGLKSIGAIDGKQDYAEGERNDEFMSRIYGTVNSTYAFLGILVIVVICSFSYFPIKSVIIKAGNGSNLWYTYFIYILSVLFNFFCKKFDAVLIGTNNVVLINRWDIINNLLSTFVSILIVFYGVNLLYLALNQLFFSLLLLVRDYYLERSVCDKYFRRFKYFTFDKEIFKWCWEPTWKSGILILSSTGITQATGFIYSNVSDTTKLSAYLLSLKLVITITQFSQAPFYSKLPSFSALRVKNNLSGLIESTASSIKKSLLVYVLGMIGLIFLGKWGLHLIKSKAELIDYKILIVMGLVYFLERNHAMHAQIYVTTNKVPFYKSAIISGAVNILLIYLLLPRFDVWAFPVALGLSNMLINNWWNVYLSIKSLNTDFFSYFKRSALLPAIIMLIFFIIKILIT